MESIWHNLRKKPIPYEILLVETHSIRCPYRICLFNHYGFWSDFFRTSYYFPKSCKKKYCVCNDFRVKRWAYLNDIKKLL